MALTLIGLVTSIYIFVGAMYCFTGNIPLGIVYFGYSVANTGLILVDVIGR